MPKKARDGAPTSATAAMLARATGTDNKRSAILNGAGRPFAELCVFARASFGASCKSGSANLVARCMFLVMPVDGRRRLAAQKEFTPMESKVPAGNGCR
jgi:hypothetical protein